MEGLKGDVFALQTRVTKQETEIKALREQAKDGLRTIKCPEQIRTLMRLVASHCKPNEACTQDLTQDVRAVSPGGLFLSLLNSEKHHVFYPAMERTPQEQDQEDVELKTFIEPPWDMSLRFLVVSRLDVDEEQGKLKAQERGQSIIQKMLQMRYREYPESKLTEAEQVLHWVYAFPLVGEKIQLKDRPTDGGKDKKKGKKGVVQGSKQDPLTKSVWVFRVNC